MRYKGNYSNYYYRVMSNQARKRKASDMSDYQIESVVKKLEVADYDNFIRIVANAYPGLKLFSEEARQNFKQQRFLNSSDDSSINFYGLFRSDELIGGMRLFDFVMQLRSVKIPAGGVGTVAVDLLHKKQKVARELIRYYLQHYRERGVALAILYPFRPDFYKQMGFGYGTRLNQYRVKPQHLPGTGLKNGTYFLKPGDESALVECYNRYMARTNGLLEKKNYELRTVFDNPEVNIVAYGSPDSPTKEISGYIVFSFQSARPDNFVMNNIIVRELVYESSEALLALLKFLQNQADQINEIIFNLADEYFYYLLFDPRNGSNNLIPSVNHETNTQALGLMYRVIEVAALFQAMAAHNFNNQTCKLKLSLQDNFLKENAGDYFLWFENGQVQLSLTEIDFEVAVQLDIADFSSLIVGAVNFNQLYRYGLATVSDVSLAETVNRIFQADQKPICTTPF